MPSAHVLLPFCVYIPRVCFCPYQFALNRCDRQFPFGSILIKTDPIVCCEGGPSVVVTAASTHIVAQRSETTQTRDSSSDDARALDTMTSSASASPLDLPVVLYEVFRHCNARQSELRQSPIARNGSTRDVKRTLLRVRRTPNAFSTSLLTSTRSNAHQQLSYYSFRRTTMTMT